MDFLLTQRLHKEKDIFKVSNYFGLEALQGWCPLSDSNRPPTDYKSVALPDELKGQSMYFILFHNS
jgi:hypothetical protein